MSADTRLKLGVALLILGLVMPVGAIPVAATDWSVVVKTVVSSIFLFGIMLIPAVALMGKENFERIWAGAMRFLKRLKPAGGVSKTRYQVGLYMLVGPTLYAWIASYAPSWLPEDYVLRVCANVGLDLITLASLFVLGGDFWDKVRALFLHDARVIVPS
jgi:fumarate reductase subunit D